MIIETESNVISFKNVRNKYIKDKCKHKHMTVDGELNEVECDDCGAKLNPAAMLLRIAHEESAWKREIELLTELHKRLDKRIRCKCEKCGEMTNIKIT